MEFFDRYLQDGTLPNRYRRGFPGEGPKLQYAMESVFDKRCVTDLLENKVRQFARGLSKEELQTAACMLRDMAFLEEQLTFRGVLVSYQSHWQEDCFVFEFGDGELMDESGDPYFVRMERKKKGMKAPASQNEQIVCEDGEYEWFFSIWWEDDNTGYVFDDLDAYITRAEMEQVKGFAKKIMETG